jgi:hypothetical protein
MQFLSLRLLQYPNTLHQVSDDFESFIHVLLWIAGGYAPNTMSPAQRSGFLAWFDYDAFLPAERKTNFIFLLGEAARGPSGPQLATKPFESLLVKLMINLRHKYDDLLVEKINEGLINVKLEEVDTVRALLKTHAWMQAQLNTALGDAKWKGIRDAAQNHPLPIRKTTAAAKKRKIDIDDLMEERERSRRYELDREWNILSGDEADEYSDQSDGKEGDDEDSKTDGEMDGEKGGEKDVKGDDNEGDEGDKDEARMRKKIKSV